MEKIHVMDDILANKIAAGEVVERISSVVKELTENSIDAGSKNIKIELIEAGTRSIKIVDNIELLNIDENVEKWADIIIKNDIYYNRNKAMDTLINNGYDIKTESKKIEDYYITRYKLEYYTK